MKNYLLLSVYSCTYKQELDSLGLWYTQGNYLLVTIYDISKDKTRSVDCDWVIKHRNKFVGYKEDSETIIKFTKQEYDFCKLLQYKTVYKGRFGNWGVNLPLLFDRIDIIPEQYIFHRYGVRNVIGYLFECKRLNKPYCRIDGNNLLISVSIDMEVCTYVYEIKDLGKFSKMLVMGI